jgi:6-phosphogluconolactonase
MVRSLLHAEVLEDEARLFAAAAEHCLRVAAHCIEAAGRFHIALAGGSTPRGLYRTLASAGFRERTDWSRWEVWFGDERCVAPDHADSNYRMARESLLDQVPIPTMQIHPMFPQGELDPAQAAADYEGLLRERVPGEPGTPVLDLVLLGLGGDGHTASLFPGTPVLEERQRLVAAVYVEKLASWRITLTPPALASARELAFLVSGSGKSEIIEALRGPAEQPRYPVERLAPQGEVRWFLDRAAAGFPTGGPGRV